MTFKTISDNQARSAVEAFYNDPEIDSKISPIRGTFKELNAIYSAGKLSTPSKIARYICSFFGVYTDNDKKILKAVSERKIEVLKKLVNSNEKVDSLSDAKALQAKYPELSEDEIRIAVNDNKCANLVNNFDQKPNSINESHQFWRRIKTEMCDYKFSSDKRKTLIKEFVNIIKPEILENNGSMLVSEGGFDKICENIATSNDFFTKEDVKSILLSEKLKPLMESLNRNVKLFKQFQDSMDKCQERIDFISNPENQIARIKVEEEIKIAKDAKLHFKDPTGNVINQDKKDSDETINEKVKSKVATDAEVILKKYDAEIAELNTKKEKIAKIHKQTLDELRQEKKEIEKKIQSQTLAVDTTIAAIERKSNEILIS
jgi:hypothetical protein